MMKALYFDSFGGPEVLRFDAVPSPVPGPDELLLRTRAIGVNFADVYRRRGNYHLEGDPPYILGYEASGVVESANGQPGFEIGDRVAFADIPFANAELVAVAVDKAIPVPDDISFEDAAAVLLQGLTAHYLVHDSYVVRDGEWALVHAAAGGVGTLLTQMIRARGGRAIGLTSSAAKAIVARAAGAEEVFLYGDDWVDAVVTATGGVDVAYDSVGVTLLRSFEATRSGGTVVFYGMAGGDPEPVDPRMLMDTSKTLTGGDLWNVLTSRGERLRRTGELFELLRRGAVRVAASRIFPLADGADAHRLLESRQSTGKLLLVP